jgi:primosomal protein N' (replication factor Y)
VETIIQKFFPKIRVERMDADTTTRKDAYERILGDFRAGKVQVLVGTQMIAKGLHFPNVTLVGVIYADVSLHMPDFRAGERTFQLLAQVSGRAGRGDIPGEVIVQTFTPHHPAIQMARRLAFDEFCDQEYEARLELSYPPITHLVCITLRGKYEEKVIACSNQLARKLRPRLESRVIISDPVAAPIARAKQQYRYQLMLRCASTRAMTAPLRKALAELKFPRDITCTVDVDALSLL